MYPLVKDFLPPIDDFLERLHQIDGLKVQTNTMSTQVFGPSDLVFKTLNRLIDEAYQNGSQYSFVMKVLNGDVSSKSIPNYKR